MLEVGAVWPSHSPWASQVVLVQKNDSKLWFWIDSRKLNGHTFKDSYSLPRIEDTLDSLNRAVWFTALDLKLGYWQVMMDKASKPLMAFMVGPLGFYKCDHVPFWLVNTPAMSQRLMETCLGYLQLISCLIYLDDIICCCWHPSILGDNGVYAKDESVIDLQHLLWLYNLILE